VVDDEAGYLELLSASLSARGYDVVLAKDGAAALEAATGRTPDVTILDLGLPDLDGVEVCRRLRRFIRTPILVLTADGAEERKVLALDAGADDYVTKPFSMPELLARVRVQVRHRQLLSGLVDDDQFTLGDLHLDPTAREAAVGDQRLTLTRKEYALLDFFARNAGRVLTHQQLLQHVWGTSASMDTLRTHVTRLRAKLGDASSAATIEGRPGVGYRLRIDQ
jgi:two-component system KDP operon response regulator KdpE